MEGGNKNTGPYSLCEHETDGHSGIVVRRPLRERHTRDQTQLSPWVSFFFFFFFFFLLTHTRDQTQLSKCVCVVVCLFVVVAVFCCFGVFFVFFFFWGGGGLREADSYP